MNCRLRLWPKYELEQDGHKIPLSRLEGALLSRLWRGGSVTWDELIDSMYGDREDGGPLDPINCIKVIACRLRKKLKHTSIELSYYRWGEMMLVPKLGKTIDGIADKIIADADEPPD